MDKCIKCRKQRPRRDLLRCSCCDGLYCIIDDPCCADKHEESGE